jgi:hypothetical protein
MDALTLFGLATVAAMLVFYALEDRSPWFRLACALGSIYGFLQGAGRLDSSGRFGRSSRSTDGA